eukprot:15479781-Alexandrium_andersonii.AAC.1
MKPATERCTTQRAGPRRRPTCPDGALKMGGGSCWLNREPSTEGLIAVAPLLAGSVAAFVRRPT